VSLLPAATDIVAALDLTDHLVGRTHECDWPAERLADVPVVTATGIAPEWSSREISAAVGSSGHGGSSLYEVDLAALAAAAPDIIVTQDLCQQCAVSYRSVNDAVRVLELDTVVVSLEARTIAGILDSIDGLADLLGVPERARRLRTDLCGRLAALPGPDPYAPSVLFVEWLDPLMPGGHWVPEQIAAAGGRSALLAAGEHSTPRPWSILPDRDPDVIVFGPCGFEPAKTVSELPDLVRAIPGWAGLAAVRTNQVWIVDGPSYFNRPGPRVVDGAEILAGIFAGRPDTSHCLRWPIG
jgi:iron complex transport system substrate-binding protein